MAIIKDFGVFVGAREFSVLLQHQEMQWIFLDILKYVIIVEDKCCFNTSKYLQTVIPRAE